MEHNIVFLNSIFFFNPSDERMEGAENSFRGLGVKNVIRLTYHDDGGGGWIRFSIARKNL